MTDRKNKCYYLQNGSKYYQKVVIYLNVLINQKQNISFRSVDKWRINTNDVVSILYWRAFKWLVN